MLRWLLRSLADPRIEKHLLADEGEHVVDEVKHHWAVYVIPFLECVIGVLLLVLFVFSDMRVAWLVLLVAIGLFGMAGWKALNEHMDRFVITNMRVFRIRGVLSQRLATMPIARILDITVEKPLAGRMIGYGHFVFESAAQEQGLREIRYIGDPDERDLTIQRVIQRSGLRGEPGRMV
ncbi:MAG: PH domain-containing protein [Nocardioidaceae bacterium]